MLSNLKGWAGYCGKEDKIDRTTINNDENNFLNHFNGYTDIDFLENVTGTWNQDGDVDPVEHIKEQNFKDYAGYTWDGFISIKKQDSYELGLINKEDYYNFTKDIIPKLIVNSGFDLLNTNWYACVHHDSSVNFNIHFYIIEKKPTKIKYEDRLLPKSAIKRFKSNAVSYLINRDEILRIKDERFLGVVKEVRINNLTKIDRSRRTYKTSLESKLEKLYKQLPVEHRLQYNSPNMNKVRPLLDDIIKEILGHPKLSYSYKNYELTLEKIDKQNKEYYGKSKEDDYKEKQIHKLYSRIGNDILKEFKALRSENFLSNQKEFLSKNIFKLKLKTKNDITKTEQIKIGISLLKIADYYDINSKKLIGSWYLNSKFKDNFNDYYQKIIKNQDYKSLTTTEFKQTFSMMGMTNAKYDKQKQKYYFNKILMNRVIQNAYNHVRYEMEQIEKEIEYSMSL